MEKNDAQISGFLVVKKAPSPWKKCFSKKKSVQLICADTIFKNGMRKFFWNKWVSRYLTFGDFMVLKNCSSPWNVNKTRLTKKQQKPAHRFRSDYLTDHLVKFLQHKLNPEELELLEYAQVSLFLMKTFRVVHVNRQW